MLCSLSAIEEGAMKRVRWIRSGIEEDLDARQQRILEHVLSVIREYYDELHETRRCYQHPLSLKNLCRLSNRSGYQVLNAIRVLANTIGQDEIEPPIFYDRVQSERNKSHRPYRIFLRKQR